MISVTFIYLALYILIITQNAPNDNTNDAPNGGRAILRDGEVGLG